MDAVSASLVYLLLRRCCRCRPSLPATPAPPRRTPGTAPSGRGAAPTGAPPGSEPADPVVLAALSRLLPRTRWSTFLVTPATLLGRHRELIARRSTYAHARPGRPSVDKQVHELVM